MKLKKKKVNPTDESSEKIWAIVKVLLMQAIPLIVGVLVAQGVLNQKLHANTVVPQWIDFSINFLYSFKFFPYFAVFFIFLPLLLLSKRVWFKSLKFNHSIVNAILVLFTILIVNKIYSFMTLVYIFSFLPKQVPFIEKPSISLLMIPGCFLLACVITYYYGKLMKSLKR